MSKELLVEEKREFPLSKESFTYMRMIAKRIGIDINDYREAALYNRLVRRLRTLKLPDFDSYCQRLRLDIEEENKFINLISNNTTYFFREEHHFEYLAEFLPKIIAKKRSIRIWSAGCATGEEPYSLAMVVSEVIPNYQQYDIKILATDINTDALLAAKKGIYTLNQLKNVSRLRLKLFFKRIGSKDSTFYEINPSLKKLVTFKQLNLMDPWPMHGPFDVIICRNVLIYFKPDVRQSLLEKFTKFLDIGNVLMLGYSESISEEREHYVPVGKMIFKKIR